MGYLREKIRDADILKRIEANDRTIRLLTLQNEELEQEGYRLRHSPRRYLKKYWNNGTRYTYTHSQSGEPWTVLGDGFDTNTTETYKNREIYMSDLADRYNEISKKEYESAFRKMMNSMKLFTEKK